jgi:hypothetical protein
LLAVLRGIEEGIGPGGMDRFAFHLWVSYFGYITM